MTSSLHLPRGFSRRSLLGLGVAGAGALGLAACGGGPTVGGDGDGAGGGEELDLDFEGLELASSPGLYLNVYTAAAGTPTADALKLLATWGASQDRLATETVPAAGG